MMISQLSETSLCVKRFLQTKRPIKKILILLPSYDAGGAENYALRLIEYAGNQDYEWHVTSGNPNNRGMEPKFEAAGAEVNYVSPGFGLTPRVVTFWRFLRRHRFDAVMSLNGVFAGVPMALARLTRISVRVAWHRRTTPAYAQTRGRRAYARLALDDKYPNVRVLMRSIRTDSIGLANSYGHCHGLEYR